MGNELNVEYFVLIGHTVYLFLQFYRLFAFSLVLLSDADRIDCPDYLLLRAEFKEVNKCGIKILQDENMPKILKS